MATSPEIDALGTITTPVNIDAPRLELRADYFSTLIPLATLQARYTPAQVLNSDPLVLKISGNSHVVVLSFGAVVFWQCDELVCSKVLETIQQLPSMKPPNPE